MAKPSFKGALGRKKKEILDTKSIEDITAKSHQEQEGRGEETEDTKRASIDLPKSLHHKTKAHAAKRGLSMKNYIRGLIEKDLEESNNQ